MFGLNPIRSVEHHATSLAVEDMFYTLQGEGPQSGRPALFIRLAGCNLACHFCDTQFETQATSYITVEELTEKIAARFTPRERKLVVMTGGEPMRQNWSKLASWLVATGTQLIQVETAGTLWQRDLEVWMPRIQIVCSPKTPKVLPRVEDYCQHWKFIVRAGEVDAIDGLPNHGTQKATKDTIQHLFRPVRGTIWLSPCDDYDPVKNKANQDLARDLCLRHGYRLSLQVHKIVGVE